VEESDQNNTDNTVTAQTQNVPKKIIKPKLSLEELYKDKNLSEQFEILTNRSESYNDFKVIKKASLNNFWVMVQDSITILKQNIATNNETIANQAAEAKSLESVITKKDEKLAQTDFAMTHISFLGIDFSKSTFIIISVVLILGFAVLLSMGFSLYWRSNVVTSQKIRECDIIAADFEKFKMNSLEKQVRLNRELQTERNALEEFRLKSTITKKMHA
jgi:hypothetical protein